MRPPFGVVWVWWLLSYKPLNPWGPSLLRINPKDPFCLLFALRDIFFKCEMCRTYGPTYVLPPMGHGRMGLLLVVTGTIGG